MTQHLYHLALESDWQAAVKAGSYEISTIGRTIAEEGFMHMSFAAQVDGVASRYYRDVAEPLVLLRIDLTKVDGEIKLEVPPGASEAYPHLYGALNPAAVVAVTEYEVSPVGPDGASTG